MLLRRRASPLCRTKQFCAKVLGLVLNASLLASCTRVEIEDHSLQFNQAAGSLGNRLLLLNAVRAAKGYPVQFSKLTSYTGQSRLDGALNLNLPFVLNTFGNPAPTRIQGSATPSATVKTGVQNLALTDLNTAEIQKALRKQVTANDFAYYRSQGWQKALVNTILVESIWIEPRLNEALKEASVEACRSTRLAKRREACEWLLSPATRSCLTSRDGQEERASQEGELVLVYSNNPRRYCQHVSFQWFFTAIRVLAGASLDLDLKVDPDECRTTRARLGDIASQGKGGRGDKDKSKDTKGDTGDDKRFNESVKDGKVSVDVNVKISEKSDKDDDGTEKSKKPASIGLNIPKGPRGTIGLLDVNELAALARLRNEQLCLLKEGRTPINIVWRSPERMVRYLGDVVAVQMFRAGDKAGPVQILNEDGEPVDLFRVERGRDVLGNAAVSVEGPERESFTIPTAEPGERYAHLSLQSLALVMESFNQAVSGKALPQPATIFLSGG